jgi:hypothetical protein
MGRLTIVDFVLSLDPHHRHWTFPVHRHSARSAVSFPRFLKFAPTIACRRADVDLPRPLRAEVISGNYLYLSRD